jgi:8-amino-7-oxononanoate synthase
MMRAREGGVKEIFLAVESLYSMDGDFAPLEELSGLALEFGATLIVDEAHATGVFGPTGRGLSESLPQENVIAVHTGGKALGVVGALVTGRAEIIQYLINAARPFIYSTAPPPMLAAALTRALELVDEEPWRRDVLKTRVSEAERALRAACGPALAARGSQILPVIVGAEARAVAVADALQAKGFDVRAIRPPTVPDGTSRLRVSISAAQTAEDVSALGNALAECLERA